MPRYQKIGTIKKIEGLLLYEFNLNYSLLQGKVTDVFVKKIAKDKQHMPERDHNDKMK